MTERTYAVELTEREAKGLRVALIFGDPGLEGQPDPVLESAKAKLKSVEERHYLSTESSA